MCSIEYWHCPRVNPSPETTPISTFSTDFHIFIGGLNSSCMRSSMPHGSETWPTRKENKMALERAEMRMVRWMCGVNLRDKVQSKGLRERERLRLDNIISILQQNTLQWYGHELQKEDNDRVKKCMEHEVECARPRGRPKKTLRLWKKTGRHINWTEDAMDRSRCRKQIRDNWWPR